MSSTISAHRRTHNLLLISKLLNLRDGASPFTLVLDSLEQPAARLLREYIRRAKLSKSNVIYVSLETLSSPAGVDTFITTRRKTFAQIAKEVRAASASNAPSPAPAQPGAPAAPTKRSLVIFDSVHPLVSRKSSGGPTNIVNYLGSLLAVPGQGSQAQTSLVAVYHQDMPIPSDANPYAPSPYALLSYLATAILTVHSMDHLLAEKAARDRSLAAPVFGLPAEQDGVLIGQNVQAKEPAVRDGVVIQMEHRRRSGRNVEEWYFLPPDWSYDAKQAREVVILLDDHPLFQKHEEPTDDQDMVPESTFELGLTEKQRREREQVVLPYYDAQKGAGPGEGGRILYDMGEEDDFDEEEDEI
ncbi:hypothetical protein KEM55_003068 [Ascosphaera atra]|nr:hypothetical protein KEM55_003068 [Ascosphaera atra]